MVTNKGTSFVVPSPNYFLYKEIIVKDRFDFTEKEARQRRSESTDSREHSLVLGKVKWVDDVLVFLCLLKVYPTLGSFVRLCRDFALYISIRPSCRVSLMLTG